MYIDDSQEYCRIWDKVDEKLKFAPSCYYRGHSMNVPLPFQIEGDYAVYGIDNMTDEQIDLVDKTIKEIFAAVAPEGRRMYTLDWHHSAFIFDPRNDEEQKDVWIADEKLHGGGYFAYFPGFLPDGDYYFFIDELFEFGYLGHPWRQEIWVFGDKLTAKIEEVYHTLGWQKIR